MIFQNYSDRTVLTLHYCAKMLHHSNIDDKSKSDVDVNTTNDRNKNKNTALASTYPFEI